MSDNNSISNSEDTTKAPSRREIIKYIGATASVSAPGYFVGTANASSEKVEIVTHRSVDDVKIAKEVPKSWKEHCDLVSSIRDNLAYEYRSIEDVKFISIKNSDEYYGGKQGFAIKIEVESPQVREQISNSIQGIPIETVKPVERILEGCDENDACYNERVADDTPGGFTFDGATSCCQYYVDFDDDDDDSYEKTMLTATHVVGDTCNENPIGNSVNQHCESWGKVVESNPQIDVSACYPTEYGKSVDNMIADQYDPVEVNGFVTEYGLKDMQSNGDLICSTGIKTGTTYGTIEETNIGDSGCKGYGGEGVAAKIDTAAGDSGSPVYDKKNGDAYIAYLHSAGGETTDGTDCQGDDITTWSHGTAAYEINDTFGGRFVSPI